MAEGCWVDVQGLLMASDLCHTWFQDTVQVRLFGPQWKWVEEREVRDDDIAVTPDRNGSHLLKKVSAE